MLCIYGCHHNPVPWQSQCLQTARIAVVLIIIRNECWSPAAIGTSITLMAVVELYLCSLMKTLLEESTIEAQMSCFLD